MQFLLISAQEQLIEVMSKKLTPEFKTNKKQTKAKTSNVV